MYTNDLFHKHNINQQITHPLFNPNVELFCLFSDSDPVYNTPNFSSEQSRRHPFSPVLEPRQGGDICSLAGLTWPHVFFPATMSSLQYRHGAPPRHGAMCRGPPSGGFHPVGGLYPSLASIFPAHYCPLYHLVSFLRAITLIND